MICTLCSTPLTHKKDAYYYDCPRCKALVKDTTYHLPPDAEKARYESHQNDVNDPNYQHFTSPISTFVLDNFLPEHQGLDFGSGTGPVISSMLLQKGYAIAQYDPYFSPNHEVLKSNYDYIVSCEVFEHFYKPKFEIDRLVSLLKPGGALLIMTLLYDDSMDFEEWFYRKDPTHVFIYRKETMAYIAQEHHLEIAMLTNRFIVFKKID